MAVARSERDSPKMGHISRLLSDMADLGQWGTVRSEADRGNDAAGGLAEAMEAWAERWFKDSPYWLMDVVTLTLYRLDKGLQVDDLDWTPDDELRYDHSPFLAEPQRFEFDSPGLELLAAG